MSKLTKRTPTKRPGSERIAVQMQRAAVFWRFPVEHVHVRLGTMFERIPCGMGTCLSLGQGNASQLKNRGDIAQRRDVALADV